MLRPTLLRISLVVQRYSIERLWQVTYILLNDIHFKACSTYFAIFNAAFIFTAIILKFFPPDDAIGLVRRLVLVIRVVKLVHLLSWCPLI